MLFLFSVFLFVLFSFCVSVFLSLCCLCDFPLAAVRRVLQVNHCVFLTASAARKKEEDS